MTFYFNLVTMTMTMTMKYSLLPSDIQFIINTLTKEIIHITCVKSELHIKSMCCLYYHIRVPHITMVNEATATRLEDHIDGLVKEWHNFSALTMELRRPCTNPLIFWFLLRVTDSDIRIQTEQSTHCQWIYRYLQTLWLWFSLWMTLTIMENHLTGLDVTHD